jgi:hypothetical protein
MCLEIRGDYGDKWYALLSSQIGVHAVIYKLLSLFFLLSCTIRQRTENNLCSCPTVVQQPVTVQLNTMSETQLAAWSNQQNWHSTAHPWPAVPKHCKSVTMLLPAIYLLLCNDLNAPHTALQDSHIKGQKPSNAYNTVHKSHTCSPVCNNLSSHSGR